MRKRRSTAPEGDGVARKRIRVVHEAPTFEAILSARQLMQLLSFDQDIQKARHGLQSFKVLLDRINDAEKRTPEDVAILHGYLRSTSPRTESNGDNGDDADNTEPVFLADIMDSWSFAAKLDNDSVRSAVPVVLALLLKYISHVLELAPIGLGICRTLLLPQQLDLIAKNLSAEKSKEFIISPTLRMLREVVTFDGGAVAKALFRARNFTFRLLARNMGIKFLGEGIEDAKRTSARTNAVRFFLATLKFLHPEAKAELLSQRDIVGALTRTIRDDPPYVVHDLLESLQSHVMRDRKLSRMVKARLLNSATLVQIASLYSYAHDNSAAADDEESGGANRTSVSDAAHQFLLHACTSPTAGVLRDQYGCYPKGAEPDTAPSTVSTANTDPLGSGGGSGLDRIVWMDKFINEVPVHNLALSDLIATLRPWYSTRQSELLIAVFKEAPELIAWYFINKKSFTFEPKISATWVGFSTLLFNTIRVDLPPYFGSRQKYAHIPPPTSVVVDNILPLPLSQKILGRCLNHKSKLAPFFAVRLLAISLEKLRAALQMHDEAAKSYPAESLWAESSRRVIDEFCRRCSPMKDIINTYRGIAEDDLLYREAASRVLRLCYEVTPQVALLARFDVSSSLFTVLRQANQYEGSPQDKVLKLMELENLLAIAGYSPAMRWFSKAEGLTTSPFVALVKVYTEAPADLVLNKVREMLEFVAREQEIVLSAAGSSGLSALFGSLQQLLQTGATPSTDSVWTFVDNCAVRCAMAPIKYIEMLQDLSGEGAKSGDAVDPITMTIAEQLSFATANGASEATLNSLADFVLRYFEGCSGSKTSLKPIFKKASSAFPDGSRAAAKLAKGLPKRSSKAKERSSPASGEDAAADDSKTSEKAGGAKDNLDDQESLEDLLELAPVSELDNAALAKWANRPADELVEEGYAASLIMLLASEHTSIRKEALVNLAKMAAKIRESTYAEKDQTWLLLSELVASARAWTADQDTANLPLPSHILSFACHALDALRNPLHRLYGKVNAFLTAGPIWRLGNFPLVHNIVHDGPTEDDSYYAEINWLLAYLLDSLRTPADVGLFRTRRLFETMLSVASNPYLRFPLRRQVLRILCRAASIEGGSTTLITRSGIISWLAARKATAAGEDDKPMAAERATDAKGDGEEARIVRALLQRLWETSDQERVENWSMHGIQESIRNLRTS
ncbi:ribosome biogenesis protein [Grosmannia clavigera kw1407]|uniref:Ribosome biogenesis protein n=1 Tax=Grosmannia clavigera (strain kw1407 / UAMH 11150) TaxID=655863 RepID=F0XUV9_GROCL|nr:ribosome biogenesis protein [Grosmannia clavigera kw1407]EFW99033.1 ribosome biogenesis protein [Grosmannia clavigera kw1407]